MGDRRLGNSDVRRLRPLPLPEQTGTGRPLGFEVSSVRWGPMSVDPHDIDVEADLDRVDTWRPDGSVETGTVNDTKRGIRLQQSDR